jgi:hypothetical protein
MSRHAHTSQLHDLSARHTRLERQSQVPKFMISFLFVTISAVSILPLKLQSQLLWPSHYSTIFMITISVVALQKSISFKFA